MRTLLWFLLPLVGALLAANVYCVAIGTASLLNWAAISSLTVSLVTGGYALGRTSE